MRFAETLTSVNETDFGGNTVTADYEQPRDATDHSAEERLDNEQLEKSEKEMPKVTADGRTGWEGWEDEEWKEAPEKAELDQNVKVSESSITNLQTRHRYLSGDQTTDTEAGYETAREGQGNTTEGTETETDAFYSADEDLASDGPVLVPGTKDDDATPRASPLPETDNYRDGVTVVERVNNPNTVTVFDPKGKVVRDNMDFFH